MQHLSELVKNMPVSETIAMAQMAREMNEQGIDVINLSLGEPDFGTPAYIIEGAKKGMDDGFTHYPPVPGYSDLRKAICQKFKRDNDLDYTPEQIVVSTGAKQSLANIILSVVNPGDEVVIPAPYWVTYAAQVKMAGGILHTIDSSVEQNFKISPRQLDEALSDKAVLFIYSSPCNPTGSSYSREELAALAEVFERYPQVLIISDEIYEYINFESGHVSIAEFPGLKERVAIVNGLSKGFAMTGWRLGYMAAPRWLADACGKIQGQFTSAASSITQRAALTALTGDMQPTFDMADAFKKRRDLVLHLLGDISDMKMNRPEGAFYIFPDISAVFGKRYNGEVIPDADRLCMLLLKEAHVSTVTGSAFGNGDCMRISYATSEENLREASRRLHEFFEKLH